MTGLGGPAQTEVETTSTSSAAGAGVAVRRRGVGSVAAGRRHGRRRRSAAGDRSPASRRRPREARPPSRRRSSRTGTWPGSSPPASRRKTSAVCDIEYAAGSPVSTLRVPHAPRVGGRPDRRRRVPVRATNPAGRYSAYSWSQAGVSRAGSTLTKTARAPSPVASIASPTVPIVAGQTSGQCVYPKKTKTGEPRSEASENGRPSWSVSSIGGAAAALPARNADDVHRRLGRRRRRRRPLDGRPASSATRVPRTSDRTTQRTADDGQDEDEPEAAVEDAAGRRRRSTGSRIAGTCQGCLTSACDLDRAGVLEDEVELERAADRQVGRQAHDHEVLAARLERDRPTGRDLDPVDRMHAHHARGIGRRLVQLDRRRRPGSTPRRACPRRSRCW